MKPITHISQFSLLVCSFALALTGYFILPVEPPLWLGLLLLLLGPAVFYLGRRYQQPVTKRVAVFVIAASIGFVWAQGRAHMQARVSAPPEFGAQTISGTLLWHEATPRGSRWDVVHQDTNGGAYVVRLYGKRAHLSAAQPGCAITVTADIEPLPTPIIMGGYDPRRDAWFAGRRGRGFIRDIDNVDCPDRLSWAYRLARARLALARHYRLNMSDDAGPVAAALVTGVRGAIDGSVRDAFRHSGLAHMLAISGLHMALFAGSVYALLRLLAALLPGLVLRYDVRKPCALISLSAATGYLFLSGAGVATQRAYIMLAIFFLAILLDRPAITMRNVLWAALLVLLWQPHAVMQAGFQMSFAAVMALVAVYEAWRRHDTLYLRFERLSPARQVLRRLWRYGTGLFVTSLIAGSVTGFIALVRFLQLGTYGLPANLLAMPLFATLIMPMAPVSLLLLPLGADGPILSLMQFGIESVLAVAGFFTASSGALFRPGVSAAFVMPLATIGFVVLCLVPTRWRLIGLAPLLVAFLGIGQGERPVLHMFGRDLIAVRGSDDALLVLRRNGHRYELDRLARYHGVTPEAPACPSVCRVWLKGGVRLAYHNRPIGLTQSCRNVDVVVMPFDEARYPCDALLFDKRAFQTRMHRQFSARKGKLVADEISNARLWQRD